MLKFLREDLLWRGQVHELRVPIEDGPRWVGPTVLDIVQRHDGDKSALPYWTLRPPRDFALPRTRSRGGRVALRPGLVSGGRQVALEGEFMRVAKASSVSLSAYVYRLAVGALGGLRDGQAAVAARAAAAWRADLERARQLYEAIRDAPGGRLVETPAVAALRPPGSISDQVEADILREACTLLGVDPDLPIKRAPGRPRNDEGRVTEAGEWISVTVVDGLVSGRTMGAINGIDARTDLANCSVLKLIALLQTLLAGGAHVDAQLLEAYLDASAPDWRNAAYPQGLSSVSSSDDPYSVLGVRPAMPLREITQAYRRAMQALHPDKGACPPWFAQAATQAYRKIRQDLHAPPDPSDES